MAIEMQCTGCGRTLRVGDEHAGKKARCPACGNIAEVPAPGQVPVASKPVTIPDNPFAEAAAPATPDNPFADRSEISPNPYVSPSGAKLPAGKPHRGGTVLTLGIIGILCCAPLRIAAWVMGASDLKQIRQGQMDPAGYNLTQAGMIIGIVATVLMALGLILQIAAVVMGGLAGGM